MPTVSVADAEAKDARTVRYPRESACAGGVTAIASNLGLTRTSVFAELTAIFLSGRWDANAGDMSALRRTLASHLSSFFQFSVSAIFTDDPSKPIPAQ
jgi:hypothetical protein